MTAQHTPGPWRKGLVTTKRDATNVYGICGANGKRICDIREYDETARADISLIIAGPDLLEALKAELVDLEQDIRWAESSSDLANLIKRRERLEAAIAKATTKEHRS